VKVFQLLLVRLSGGALFGFLRVDIPLLKKYFDLIFSKIGKVESVVLLGDVKHNFGGILKQEWNDVLGLFDYFEGKLRKNGKIIIVRGNHDNILEPIVRKRKNVVMKDYFVFNDVVFLHGDRSFKEIYDKKIRYWIIGHGHPAVKLSDGVKVEKFKCFLVGRFKGWKIIVVPSFFEYSSGSDPRESELGLAWNFNLEGFRVLVVDEDREKLEVLDFGILHGLG